MICLQHIWQGLPWERGFTWPPQALPTRVYELLGTTWILPSIWSWALPERMDEKPCHLSGNRTWRNSWLSRLEREDNEQQTSPMSSTSSLLPSGGCWQDFMGHGVHEACFQTEAKESCFTLGTMGTERVLKSLLFLSAVLFTTAIPY